MAEFSKIFFDFDGVILDSHRVREAGFRLIFEDFSVDQVKKLISYHKENGGLSRYHKIDYFFDVIAKQEASKNERDRLARKFSDYMRNNLTNHDLLIPDVISFIRQYHALYPMHIISGSDQEELRFLCAELEIDQYFRSIRGSPTPKINLVEEELEITKYNVSDIVFIGDAVNDYDAASAHQVKFLGYNNQSLKGMGLGYLDHFSLIHQYLA